MTLLAYIYFNMKMQMSIEGLMVNLSKWFVDYTTIHGKAFRQWILSL